MNVSPPEFFCSTTTVCLCYACAASGPDKIGETVAVIRGMNVKTFKIPEDAIEWLTDPTDSQCLLTTQVMRLLG
jgi:hypothetical protein